jgi:hypothetical protein
VAAALPGHLPVAERRAATRRQERVTRHEREAEAAWQEHLRSAARAGRKVDEDSRWWWSTRRMPAAPDESWADPMRVAGAAALSSAAAVVAWLNRRPFQDPWSQESGTPELLERVLSARTPEWQADFAVRAALRLRPSARRRRRRDDFAELALAMLRRSGAVPPEHDPLVVAWTGRAVTAAELRRDPLLDHLVPRLFEAEGVGTALRDERPQPLAPGTWLAALRDLESEGRIPRDLLLDGCLRRFLRGGAATDLRFFVHLHELLEPTHDEVGKRARDYLRLLPAAPGTVAELSLRHLRRLPDALEPADVAEALRSLLHRPERKLVTAGLTWFDEVAKAGGDAGRGTGGELDEVASGLGHAFACESGDVQGRAVRMAVKHAKRFSPAGAEDIRAAIGVLPQELGETLAAVFGGAAAESDAYEDDGFTPVPLPEPRPCAPLPPPVMTAGELGAIPYREAWRAGERWLAGVVRLHALDRDGLVAALASTRTPGVAGPWLSVWEWCEEIAAVLRERGTTLAHGGYGGRAGKPRLPQAGTVSAPHLFLLRRWAEVSEAAQGGTLPPYLLAEPTEGTGHVDAAELVRRLEGYERPGAQALPADLQQALLRLPREIAPEVAARARRLTSEAGRTAARWMDGGRPEPVTEIGWAYAGRLDEAAGYRDDREPADSKTPDLMPRIRVAPTGLPLIDDLLADPDWRRKNQHGGLMSWWPSVLPSHREVVALHFVPHLLYHWQAPELTLPEAQALLQAGGPWGEGAALVLACFLAERSWSAGLDERARLVTDAAARGDLDAGQLGRQLALLLRRTWVKPGRVFEALETAAGQGAHREVWAIMRGFLPVFLPGPGERPNTRHAQGLAFALRAARWSGARGPLACVAEIAGRRASNTFVREARRLHTYLT